MELIGKQIAIETILGQPPELHYPSWYAAQIEKLPPAPPEYLAKQAGILVTDADTISRAKAIEALTDENIINHMDSVHDSELHRCKRAFERILSELPPAQPERIRGHWIESDAQNRLMKNLIAKGETWRVCDKCGAGFMIGYQHESDKIYHETFHNFCPKCGAEMEVAT